MDCKAPTLLYGHPALPYLPVQRPLYGEFHRTADRRVGAERGRMRSGLADVTPNVRNLGERRAAVDPRPTLREPAAAIPTDDACAIAKAVPVSGSASSPSLKRFQHEMVPSRHARGIRDRRGNAIGRHVASILDRWRGARRFDGHFLVVVVYILGSSLLPDRRSARQGVRPCSCDVHAKHWRISHLSWHGYRCF